jgi:4-aminobutyrate aminotransferase-like enzyme
MAPILGELRDGRPPTVFDLSVGSPLVGGDPQENREPWFGRRLRDRMAETGAAFGVGRHDEPRLTDVAGMCGEPGRAGDEASTIHLGMDFFVAPGAAVFVPMEGVVVSCAQGSRKGCTGRSLVVEHRTGTGEGFYTIYRHLAGETAPDLGKETAVGRGDRLGTVASAEENGGYPAHLHFQIAVDLMGMRGDFPGACPAERRSLFTRFSPDPNLIVGFPRERFPKPATGKSDTLAARRRLLGRNLSIAYRDPVKVERGWMQYLFDENGRRYLDAYNNVPHLGHCHPRIVRVLREQAGLLSTNTRYLSDLVNRFAERLAATMPDPLSVCFFLNSASEANELALRLVRAHTGRRDMIVLEAAYHGNTTSLIDISPYKHDGPGGAGAPTWVHSAPVPNLYRGAYRGDDPGAAEKYAAHVGEIVDRLADRDTGPAGFIAESCPSVAGQLFLPDGYLDRVYRMVRSAGGLCIADEVQTGYGRTGANFYAFERQAVVPDMVVLGKPIGNGHPIAALVTTAAIAETFDNGMEFFSTFGGNTVSCAVGLEVLESTLEETLQAHALRTGNRLLEGLAPIKERYPIVGDVRCRGLFGGIELVRDRHTLEPAAEEAAFVVERMREQGILLGTDGPLHNVVKIRPPMPFSERNADFFVETLDRIFSDDFSA